MHKMYEPISPDFRFPEFLVQMRKLTLKKMIIAAQDEGNWAFEVSFNKRGATKVVGKGSTYYKENIGAFIYFLRERGRPRSLTPKQFRSFLPIARKLVDDGDWSEADLKPFAE